VLGVRFREHAFGHITHSIAAILDIEAVDGVTRLAVLFRDVTTNREQPRIRYRRGVQLGSLSLTLGGKNGFFSVLVPGPHSGSYGSQKHRRRGHHASSLTAKHGSQSRGRHA